MHSMLRSARRRPRRFALALVALLTLSLTGCDFLTLLTEPVIGSAIDQVSGNRDLLVAGEFFEVNGIPRQRIVRLTTAGEVVTSFDVQLDFPVDDIAVAKMGEEWRIFIAGGFSVVNGVTYSGLAALLPDGRPDTRFNPSIGLASYSSVYVDSAFGMVYAGALATPGIFAFTWPDGAQIAEFAPTLDPGSGAAPHVLDIGPALSDAPTGSIAVAGDFRFLDAAAVTRGGATILTPSGDAIAYPPIEAVNPIIFYEIATDARSGTYRVAGDIQDNGTPFDYAEVFPLNPTAESAFNTTTLIDDNLSGTPYSSTRISPDSTILAGNGEMVSTTVTLLGFSAIARYTDDGARAADLYLEIGTVPTQNVWVIRNTTSGIYIGGDFTTATVYRNGIPTTGNPVLLRLNDNLEPDPAFQPTFSASAVINAIVELPIGFE